MNEITVSKIQIFYWCGNNDLGIDVETSEDIDMAHELGRR